jgi:gliding motility-associated-like protein
VLDNNGNGRDTLNGNDVLIDEIILSIVTPATPIDGSPVPLVNTRTGQINVPAGTAPGTYTIVYQICESVNQNNCATATVTINVAVVLSCDALVIHNAISPNGDGTNDLFTIENITDECYVNNTVEIYNRWGVLVFETKNYNNTDNTFDGTSRGRTNIKQSEGLPTGTYFYILNYSSETTSGTQTYTKNGYLYLTR